MNSSRQSPGNSKRCSLLQRRSDLSTEAFRDHWSGPHADIAKSIPGIAQYTQNRVIERIWSHVPEGEGYDCDGLVELEFSSESSMVAANASDAVRNQLPFDELRFLGGITLCRVPGGARQVWPGQTKVMLAARLSNASTDRAQACMDLLSESGCAAYSVDWVSDTFHRPQLRYEQMPPQVFATFWFSSLQGARAAFGEGTSWRSQAQSLFERGAAWLCDPWSVIKDTLISRCTSDGCK